MRFTEFDSKLESLIQDKEKKRVDTIRVIYSTINILNGNVFKNLDDDIEEYKKKKV
jgi:hypothetical protein